MADICIVGRGPAGLSAGIYAARAGAKTVVFGREDGALSLAKRIDNYFGIPTIGGKELLRVGEEQFTSFGGELRSEEVTAIEMIPGGFALHTPDGDFDCRAVVLALGKSRRKAGLPGEEAFLGRGVSHCAICDGFFFRKKRIGVIGAGEYAASRRVNCWRFRPT
jgi:thioredoxin reductase (NADPH)